MAYTTINDPKDYFEVIAYAGDGNSTQNITANFQADLSWIKHRSTTAAHTIQDSVRGFNAANKLSSNENDEENDSGGATWENYGHVSAVSSSNFTVSLGANTPYQTNASGVNYIAWHWKAGTSFTNDASSTSVGSVDTTGSVNTDAGFSIMKYTGVSGQQTIAHGLSAVPKLILVKNLDSTENWRIYHHSLGAGSYLKLNTADAKVDDTGPFSNTTPTSSVITMGGDDGTMHANEELIAYIFAEKQGYSKFGTYTGNANANGPFIYTGFKPAFFIYKNTNTSGEEWKILDNKRDPFNRGSQRNLNAHLNTAESDDVNSIGEFVSNGVKN